MKKKKRLLIILGILAVAAGAVVAYLIIRDGAIKKPIKVSGNIEGDDVRISFRVEGQITELLTDEGMVIKKDDIVARLNKDELSKVKAEAEAAWEAARAAWEAARAAAEAAKNGGNK